MRASLAFPIVAGLAACGPSGGRDDETIGQSSEASGTDTSGATQATSLTSVTSATSTTTISTLDSSSNEGDAENTSSTGAQTWGEPTLLAALDDGGDDVPAAYLTTLGNYVHASSQIASWRGRSWAIDRLSGELAATNPVGGPVAATAEGVYALGLLDGGTGMSDGNQWLLARFDESGSVAEELLVSEGPLYLRAAAASGVFVERFVGPAPDNRELWLAEDDSSAAELVGNIGETSVAPAVYDLEKLFVYDNDIGALSTLDLDTLMLTPTISPKRDIYEIDRNSGYFFMIGAADFLRVGKFRWDVEELFPDVAPFQIVVDDAGVYWTGTNEEGQMSLVVAQPDGSAPEVIWTEPRHHIGAIAIDDAALYFTTPEGDGAGSVYRIERLR